MNKFIIAVVGLMTGISMSSYGQDLIKKVPSDANLVIALNGEGFFKHANLDQINTIFQRFEVFDKIAEESGGVRQQRVEDFGIDLDNKSYLYMTVNDSVQYIGALVPLADRQRFESALPPDHSRVMQEGMNTFFSSDSSARISWDDRALYIMAVVPMDNFFQQEEVRGRYGMKSEPKYSSNESSYGDVYAEDSLARTEREETVISEDQDTVFADTVDQVDEFAYVDSVLDREEYQDDYYLRFEQVKNHNDSLKNIFVKQQLDIKFGEMLSNQRAGYRSRRMRRLKSNELLHLEVNNLDSIIDYYVPYDILYAEIGVSPTFSYGYKSVQTTVAVDGNRMKVAGQIGLDKETSRYYRAMYKKKLDRRFYSFVPDDALGFLSVSVNTEAYLKYAPAIVQKIYGNMDPKISKIIDFFTTMFEVVVDEKAVAKVFSGDNLLVLNGLTQRDVKYIDYQYDEDYNYEEVEKTKKETIPQYLWVFSSEDMRLFEKALHILELQKEIINHNGVYEIVSGKSSFAPYLAMGNGMVFLSNDKDYLAELRDNGFEANGGTKYRSLLRKNRVNVVMNTQRIPGLIDELDIPVHQSLELELKDLGQYGDIYLISNGVKRNQFDWELGIDFPREGKNAVDFILDSIEEITKPVKK
ncbi:MAG: hypothetical protein ACTMH4_10965 [Sphingobacterium sp.]